MDLIASYIWRIDFYGHHVTYMVSHVVHNSGCIKKFRLTGNLRDCRCSDALQIEKRGRW